MTRPARWALAGLALFALAFVLSIGRRFSTSDEAWFVQVIHRVTGGEVLYRDVFFGATPLSVYVTAALARLFGAQVLVVKAVLALCQAASILIAMRVDRMLGGTHWSAALIAMATLVYGYPGGTAAPYSALATVFLLATMGAALVAHEAARGVQDPALTTSARAGRRVRPEVWLAAAGTAAGLCAASKQNVGAYAFAALAVTLVLTRPAADLRRALAAAAGGFAAPVALALAPVLLSGAAEGFVVHAFLNKTVYLQVGGVSYLDGLQRGAGFLARATWWDGARGFVDLHPFLLAPAAGVALAAAWIRSGSEARGTVVAVAAFTGAGVLAIFPRADSFHVAVVLPVLLVGLAYGLRSVLPAGRPVLQRIAAAGAAAWLGALLVALLLVPVVRVRSGGYRFSTLAYFRGPIIAEALERKIETHRRALAALRPEAPFLLFPEASLYYLTAGLRNPTPYDYPWITTFGPHGQSRVIEAIAAGRIRAVCLGTRPGSPLTPVELENYVRTLVRAQDLGVCTLYRRQGSAGRLSPDAAAAVPPVDETRCAGEN